MSAHSYYLAIQDVDIESVARELLSDKITSQSSTEIQCDCPHHSSSSKKSLTITPQKQAWFCFGCGVGGGVLQLVEFIQSGVVTTKFDNETTSRGTSVRPESHRNARDWLAAKIGLPPLSSSGLSSAGLSESEEDYSINIRALDCLTAASRIYHQKLLENKDALDWFQNKTKLSLSTITDQQIGYADNYNVPADLRELGFTNDEIESTGLFKPDEYGHFTKNPTFQNRITFPYWSQSRVHYMIARLTPWTEDTDFEKHSKYKKLPTHNEANHKAVAKVIGNTRLHNEDILSRGNLDYVVFTEGMTDNLSAMQHGFPAISPITVQIRHADWPRILPKLSRIKCAYLVGDNEISKAGIEGSLRTAANLKKAGIPSRIVILPLKPEQIEARQIVAERWDITDADDKKAVAEKKRSLSDEDRPEYDRLTDLAKTDLNAYFVDGHTAADFQALLDSAPTPTELAISKIDCNAPDLLKSIEPILQVAAECGAIEQEDLIKCVKNQTGSAFSIKSLRDQVKECATQEKAQRRASIRQSISVVTSPPGTLKNLIQQHRASALENKQQLNADALARAMWEWFKAHGAVAIKTTDNRIAFHYNRKLYRPNSANREDTANWRAMLFDLAGMIQHTSEDAKITEAFSHVVNIFSIKTTGDTSWLYTNHDEFTVYFNLNNEAGEILKISPAGIETMQNGSNPDGVLLAASAKTHPITYVPETDQIRGLRLINDHILSLLACPETDRPFVYFWLATFLLTDFVSIRPILRAEGSPGAGKTILQKLMSMLFFGEDHHQKFTTAAAYADAECNPIQFHDNLEAATATPELIEYLLLSATGASKEMRRPGTDSATVILRPRALVHTNGVDPIGGELEEMMRRTFIVKFDAEYRQTDGLVEPSCLATVRRHRNEIMSFLFGVTQRTLALIADGALHQVKTILDKTMKGHAKVGCNDFLSLMYLVGLSSDPIETPTLPITAVTPDFTSWIMGKNTESRSAGAEGNQIAVAIGTLFAKWKIADRDDTARQVFHERYGVALSFGQTGPQIESVSARALHVALNIVAKDCNMKWELKGPSHLGARLTSDNAAILEAGFQVSKKTGRSRQNFYTIEQTNGGEDYVANDDPQETPF